MGHKIYNKNYIKKMVIRLNEIWEGDWNFGGRVVAGAIGCVAGAIEREWRVPLLVPCGRRFEMEWLVPLLVLVVGAKLLCGSCHLCCLGFFFFQFCIYFVSTLFVISSTPKYLKYIKNNIIALWKCKKNIKY
jgi:hypothetical protein